MSTTGAMSTTAVERQESKKQLADMIKIEFGITIHPNHLGYWLKSNWTTISLLAHRINEVPTRSEDK